MGAELKTITCECGKQFEVRECMIKHGRGKYCSKKCLYKYRTRPSGLKYTLHKVNPTSFKKGYIPWCTGKKGLPSSWNKGITGIHVSPSTEFKYVNGNGYRHLLKKGLLPQKCSKCNESKIENLHVHHIDKDRTNNSISNFQVLCKYHHLQLHGRTLRAYV